MRPAQARQIIGLRMREVREDLAVPLSDVARSSGWHKSHLSRVERGLTKPSEALVEWYDRRFGADGVLVQQLLDLDAAVRQDRRATRADLREEPAGPGPPRTPAGGCVPADYHRDDRCFLVDETVPDGTEVWAGEAFDKTWTLHNAGPVAWVNRLLARQGRPGVAGWLRSPPHVWVPDTGPGEKVVVRVRLRAPTVGGACIGYFKMTDREGRLYFPDPVFQPLHCTVVARSY